MSLRYNEFMVYRLIDKLIILVLSIAMLFLQFTSWEALDAAVVGACLGVVILAMLTEVLRSHFASVILTVAACGLSYFVPEMSILLPVCAYGLFSDSSVEKVFEDYHSEKIIRNAVSRVMEKKMLWLKLLILGICITLSVKQMEFLLVIASALLALKKVYMDRHDKLITDKFDNVRYDAQKSMRLRDEISQNMDMQVRNATLSERNRIAREIHDNVGHMLTRAVVQLQAISVINKDEQTKPLLESVNNTVNEAMTNIRRSVHELHDDSIDLSIGIHEIASGIKDRFDVTVSTSIESPVPNDVKNAILGIFKEGVTNIAKHSNGKNVRLEVVENVTFWRIKVSDDGKCKPMELSRPSDFAGLEGEHGIGLYNINSRAVSCGGRTSIHAGDDGFHITVTIPRRDISDKEAAK